MVVENVSGLVFFFFFYSPVMGLEPTALYMLGKLSTMEPQVTCDLFLKTI